MKSIRLERLTLTDFQGGTFTLEAGGRDVDVHGDNGTGKTRLASAFSWLITGKDSLGRSDFAIKNLDAQGEAAHGLEHSVEGVLDIDWNEPPLDRLPDGSRTERLTLKKVYSEIWTKKRGSATATFTGHSTQHYIDGVPVSEKEYQARVVEIAGDEHAFRLLTSPTAFPALHWEKQRAMLLAVCGDTTDADVIATDEKLTPLTEILKKYKSSKTPFNDHKKVVAARRAEINKEIEKIPVRIDEQRRSLPDIAGLDRAAIESDIARLSASVSDTALRLSGVDTGSGIAELSKRLAGINADLQKMETAHYTETMKAVNRLNAQISEEQSKENDIKRRLGSIGADLKTKELRLQGFDADLETLRMKWMEIDVEAFNPEAVSYL